MKKRLKTGIDRLDTMLGGGLIPGTLTVVMGASGIGKTQLGIAFANQGGHQEQHRGIFFDMTARGDSQNHAEYARRLFDWELRSASSGDTRPDELFAAPSADQMMHIFEDAGRRVTATDLDADQWREWKVEQSRKLDQAIAFFYRHFVHGVRRCVIDGIEPTECVSDSIQFELFDYIYHQILHKDHDWVARDLFRIHFRENREKVEAHVYDHRDIGCLLLATSHEVMLDDLLTRKIESGDLLSGANTIILMGKTRDGNRMGRALQVAKHRGSVCDESIVPFEIDEHGIKL
ncbi:circadian clock protein KaiC [Novipirellula aureliae]|uniref:Circadian clock protein KaiC n=1 Tax=Novipirellula aureliae TaxID=2527966 RepID=A0A5C6E2K1_9BACT|nr:ATPase domain-containing protein [Novipirellula aureliae]TWU41379.1 circadian clock protein KaiC [Novipirellula aureliae]